MLLSSLFSLILFQVCKCKHSSNNVSKRKILSRYLTNLLPTKDYVELPNKIDEEYFNTIVYGFQRNDFSGELKLNNCILRIYHSNFTNLNSNKGAIYFFTNKIPAHLIGDIEICNCQFYNYHSNIGGSIYIFSSDTSRNITISDCFFKNNNTKETFKGGAIYINAISVTIKRCFFSYCISKNGGSIYYTCDGNKQAKNTKLSLKIQKCSFEKNVAMKNGGCFHLTMQNCKSNGLIEIKKCNFSNSTAKNQKDGKGGAVYIDAKEDSLQISIIECLFGRCFASMNGGAIYFNAVFGNISECTFENNEAKYGSQIAYMLGENLTITENSFIRNSKFDGMKNLTEFLIFSLSGSKIESQNNRVSIDESLFDISFFNGIRKHKKVTAEKTDTLCENMPSGFLNITDGSDYSKQNVYSCSRFFRNPLSVNQALLHIYRCKFTYFQSNTAIKIDSDGCTTDGSIEIVGCEFVRCNEGAVYIKSKPSSRMIKISECSFTLCQHMGGATGISFNTAYGLIEKCHFLNGYGFDGTDISYDHEVPDDSSYDLKLTITGCIFERKYSYNKGGPFIKFTKNTTFNLINNHFNFYFDLYGFHIFGWPSNLNDISGFVFSENTLFPYQESVLSNANGISLDTFKQFVFECPKNNSQTVICSSLNTDSDGPVNSRYVIGIYRCVFNGLSNTDDKRGGAIYISTSEIISDDLISPIKIYNSDFCKCRCSNGGAIYLESTEKFRLFEIESCFFSCNSYGKYNEKSISKGGAIFINSGIASFKISNSVFDSNDCGEGAAIYFVSNSSSKSYANIDANEFFLNMIKCKFSYNKGYTNGGAIFISISNNEFDKLIEFNECTFVDNRADEKDYIDADLPEYGGAIYFSDQSLVKEKGINDSFRIIDCYFIANIVSYFGGAIYIHETSKSVEISNTVFHRNTAKFVAYSSIHPSGYGGDIYYLCNSQSLSKSDDKKLFSVSNCEFTNNFALFEGGCILISIQNGDASGSFEIKNCMFMSNQARNGVSICYEYESYISENSMNSDMHTLNVVDCTFENNEASANGGAIFLSAHEGKHSKSIELNKCSFKNCTSNKGGGAIYINFNKVVSNVVLLKSLTLIECSATFGGAVYIYSANLETEIKIVSCVFIKNDVNKTSAENKLFCGGSAIYLQAINVRVNDCSFIKNKDNQIKVYNNFDEMPSLDLLSDEKTSTVISIRNCIFEINEMQFSSSLFYMFGYNKEVPAEITNCVFKGDLDSSGMNHIVKILIGKGMKKSKLRILSCNFESDSKIEMNSMKRCFNFMNVIYFVCTVFSILIFKLFIFEGIKCI